MAGGRNGVGITFASNILFDLGSIANGSVVFPFKEHPVSHSYSPGLRGSARMAADFLARDLPAPSLQHRCPSPSQIHIAMMWMWTLVRDFFGFKYTSRVHCGVKAIITGNSSSLSLRLH